jgi:hypothetical protein
MLILWQWSNAATLLPIRDKGWPSKQDSRYGTPDHSTGREHRRVVDLFDTGFCAAASRHTHDATGQFEREPRQIRGEPLLRWSRGDPPGADPSRSQYDHDFVAGGWSGAVIGLGALHWPPDAHIGGAHSQEAHDAAGAASLPK